MSEEFIGRTQELAALQELYDTDGFKMAVIYGRRRIGKTTLINHFADSNKCKCIYFVSTEMTESELLSRMGKDVLESIAPNLSGKMSFDSVFDFIADSAQKERIIFVIDEYPYLAGSCPDMNSLLQKYIDHKWKNTSLYFVLLGSIISFMKEDVLSSSAPLHGRANLEFKINPFGFKEAALFVPRYTYEEKAVVYAVTGGVAKYLELFDDSLSFDENIERLFFQAKPLFLMSS